MAAFAARRDAGTAATPRAGQPGTASGTASERRDAAGPAGPPMRSAAPSVALRVATDSFEPAIMATPWRLDGPVRELSHALAHLADPSAAPREIQKQAQALRLLAAKPDEPLLFVPRLELRHRVAGLRFRSDMSRDQPLRIAARRIERLVTPACVVTADDPRAQALAERALHLTPVGAFYIYQRLSRSCAPEFLLRYSAPRPGDPGDPGDHRGDPGGRIVVSGDIEVALRDPDDRIGRPSYRLTLQGRGQLPGPWYPSLTDLIESQLCGTMHLRPLTLKHDRHTPGFALANGKRLACMRIVTDHGNEYVCTNTFAHGTYGAVRMAISKQGTPIALRVVHSPEAPAKRDPKTVWMSCDAIEREMAIARFLADVGSGLGVIETFEIAGKIYQALPLLAGDLLMLMRAMSHVRDNLQQQRIGRCVGRRLARGLASLHAAGYVHCDVKPDNALFGAHGEVVMCDFGLTRLVADLPQGTTLGTPGYMPPEIAATTGDARTTAIDVWSLGVLLTELHVKPDPPVIRMGEKHARRVPQRWHYNPFHRIGIGRNNVFATPAEAFGSFEAWRSVQVATAFRFVGHAPAAASASDKAFHRFFAGIHAIDPELCTFVLGKLLVPRAAERAPAARMRDMLGRWQPEDSADEEDAKAGLADAAARDPERAAVLRVLADYGCREFGWDAGDLSLPRASP